MALKTRLGVLTLLVLVGALTGLAFEARRWLDIRAYDAAVAGGDFAAAAGHAGDHGAFAAAYAEQLAGHFQAARERYSRLERADDAHLRALAHYNTGNSYLEQAATLDREAEADRTVPLVELAKGSYREALRIEPALWDARYNLERALGLSPDVGERKLMELEGQQRTVRSFNATDPEGRLP